MLKEYDRRTIVSLLLIVLLHMHCNVQATPQEHFRRQSYDTDVVHIDGNAQDHHLQFYQFVSRPDIDAPRWDVKFYDKDALSTGYWFMATYEMVKQKKGDTRAWVGPHIYDIEGKLIWSGAPMFHGYNIKDFRVANVDGTPMMTGLYAHEHEAVIVNNNYELQNEVHIGKGKMHLNIHGFNTVFNGTKALAMTQSRGRASLEESRAIGYHGGRCKVIYPGFEEFDTKTWERTFTWSSQHHIHLNESRADVKCKKMWDYLHANSVDKFPDGDYLYSGRHSDTIYKVSGKDGSIVWRLAGIGQTSDFVLDGHFSGQHDARVRSQNATHTVITILDNAIRPGEPHLTSDQSRGMILVLRTDKQPMTAEVVQVYNHPLHDYAPGRGNMQLLDNGNVFMAWWNHSLQSEYASDGRLLMEARWKAELRSYRSYKFPWIGLPSQPPDVYTMAIDGGKGAGANSVTTVVYVSWNGATEVGSWKLYKSTADGETRELVATAPRDDFETMLTYKGFASYVIVEGLDREGNSLGKSIVEQTIAPADTSSPAVIAEYDWIQKHSRYSLDQDSLFTKVISAISNPFAAYVCGFVSCAVTFLVLGSISRKRGFWWSRSKRQSSAEHAYDSLSSMEVDFADEEAGEGSSIFDEKETQHALKMHDVP